MGTKSIETNDPIVERLRALARERADLKGATRIYGAILPLLRDADARVAPLSITREEARGKLEKGNPVLPGLDLAIDDQAVGGLMLELSRSMENIGGVQQSLSLDIENAGFPEDADNNGDTMPCESARLIRLALEEKKLDLSTLLRNVAAGERSSVESAARDLDLDLSLLLILTQNALKPALHAWRRQLDGLLAGDFRWDRGYCFVCGADAALGEMRENGQAMYLRCGQCGANWHVRRMRCIYCGNEDHRTLSCLFSENQRGKMHIEACDRCRRYLKVITSFSPTPPEMLPVEDLATLHLDYIARERGYGRT